MTTPDRRLPARVRAWGGSVALVVLLVLTSLAVASVSVWLVIPYLALMALILITPQGRVEREEDRGEESEAGSGPGVEGADDRTGAWDEDEAVARASTDPATVAEVAAMAGAHAPDPDPRAVKTRRGKGRGRKAKAVAESPGATATWIQIGPGKFVRAESPGRPVVAGSPTSEGEPSGAFPPSSGTEEGPADAPLPPAGDAEAPMAAEAPLLPEGEPEARAVPAADNDDGVATDPGHDQGNLDRATVPDLAAKTAAAVDAALESDPDEPPFVTDPEELDAPRCGTGASSQGDSSQGDEAEAEAVPTAEGSFAPGEDEGSDVGDRAAPGELSAHLTASVQAGGDPEPAWEPDQADVFMGVAAPGSYLDAPPSADVEPGAGASEGALAVEWARDARDQALEEIAGALVAGEIPAADLGMDATSEDGPDGDGAKDNGIAPDAFGHVQPADDEDASNQDRGAVARVPAVASDRPDRPTVGMFLASPRGSRPRIGPANATRSGTGAASPGRGARSGRRNRVSTGLRNPSRRRPGRSSHPCRTFPPRSPPALASQP